MDDLIRKEAKGEQSKLFDQKRKAVADKMVASVNEIANTKGGINVLRYLLIESGFISPLHSLDRNGRVDTDALAWNASRRQMYLDLRQFMTPEVIKLVELDKPKQVNEEEVKDVTNSFK